MEGNFKPPKALVFEGEATNWQKFRQQLDIYLKATGLDKKDDETKIAIFLNIAGDEAIDVFNTFKLTHDQKKQYKAVVQAFEDYCVPRKNIVYDRFRFFTRVQKQEEMFDHFLTDLRVLGRECNFGDQEESLIRDRIVIGINDASLQERLLRVGDLSLAAAINQARAAEAGRLQAKMLQEKSMEVAGLKQFKNNKTVQQKPNQENETKIFDCYRCGKKHKYKECPAYGKTCSKCGKINHFAVVCRGNRRPVGTKAYQKRGVNEVNTEDQEFTDYEESVNLDTFYCEYKTVSKLDSVVRLDDIKKQWTEKIKIGDNLIKVKLDTGAECSVLPIKYYKRLINVKAKLVKTNVLLVAYGGQKVKPEGTVLLECIIGNRISMVNFMVVETNSQPILGLKDCINLQLIKKLEIDSNVKMLNGKSKFVSENLEIFAGLGKVGKYSIKLKEDAVPIVKPVRKIPEIIKEKLRNTLSKLEVQGVIAKVDGPTDWVNSLVIVEKPDKSLRLCLCPLELNESIIRERFPIPTPEEISSRLAGKNVFSVLDMKDGFFQVELDEASSYLCTFGTQFGRYRFKRMPFGISSAPEVFQKVNTKIFGDIQGVEIYFDDLIIAGKDEKEHDQIMNKVVERARTYNVKFNKNKVQYKVKEVEYVGMIISKEGIKADPSHIETVLKIEEPKNVKQLQKFLGMTTYLSKFIPGYSDVTGPLRELLKKNNEWIWGQKQTNAFKELKIRLTKAPTLKILDPNLPITIQSDSSNRGIGACLLQNGQPVSFTSRALTENQVRWAPIEKELFAIVAAVEKYHQFIYGRKVVIETDHKPLIPIVKKDINKVSSRLQRMLLKLIKYDLEVKYVPGKKMFVADFLSRNFIQKSKEEPTLTEVVHSLETTLNVSNRRLNQFKVEVDNDQNLSKVRRWYQQGWPANYKGISNGELKHFWKNQNQVSVQNDIIYFNNKLVVPTALRKEMLQEIHSGHFGVGKCKKRARSLLYWPGMCREIEDLVLKCKVCEKYQYSNAKEPLLAHEIPSLPFSKVGVDIAYYNNSDYLVLIDYLSKWIEIRKLKSKDSKEVITKLKDIFSVHGVPQTIVSDNMPFASYQFKQFSISWDIELVHSSPRYPKSNGLVEKAVGIVKRIFKKCKEDNSDIYSALLAYRNTPVAKVEFTPAQMLMSRTLRTRLPCKAEVLKPDVVRDARSKLLEKQTAVKMNHDKSAIKRPNFRGGDNVLIQNIPDKTWSPGKIVSVHNKPRSYIIQNEEGREVRRNSLHVRPSRNTFQANTNSKEDDQCCVGANNNDISEPDSDIKPVGDGSVMWEEKTNTNKTRAGRIVKRPRYLKDFV